MLIESPSGFLLDACSRFKQRKEQTDQKKGLGIQGRYMETEDAETLLKNLKESPLEIFPSTELQAKLIAQFSTAESAQRALSDLQVQCPTLRDDIRKYLLDTQNASFNYNLEADLAYGAMLFAEYYLFLERRARFVSVSENLPLQQILSGVPDDVLNDFRWRNREVLQLLNKPLD